MAHQHHWFIFHHSSLFNIPISIPPPSPQSFNYLIYVIINVYVAWCSHITFFIHQNMFNIYPFRSYAPIFFPSNCCIELHDVIPPSVTCSFLRSLIHLCLWHKQITSDSLLWTMIPQLISLNFYLLRICSQR